MLGDELMIEGPVRRLAGGDCGLVHCEQRLHDPGQGCAIAANLDLVVGRGNRCRPQQAHLNGILGIRESLQCPLLERVQYDDGNASARGLVKRAIIRGWLVPGLWPMEMISSQRSKSSSETVPLPTPIDFGRPTLVASWHMFEQSGKLLVPYSRTKIWNRNAASFEVRPEV